MSESPPHVKRVQDHLPGLAVCAAVFAALIVAGALTLRVSAAGPTPVTPTPVPFDDMLSVRRWAALQPELERLPRRWIITHTIAEGDSIWSIACSYGLDADTLRWSNPDLARNPDLISPGQELVILPLPGVYHTVKGNDTVERLARTYGVEPEDITSYHLNRLKPPYRLVKGRKLVIPYGRKTAHWPKPSLAPDYPFAWPAAGPITQGYIPGHGAIDVAVAYDCPVYAAHTGRVVRVDWDDSGYWGFWVVIDHGSGLRSYYAHLKGASVAVGQWVERGQEVGRMGSTGNSTGPHVHFEIRQDGVRRNPLNYLPPNP